jgi:ArsR family transcriptional regulator, arsenate/arsenite/antimonite-responsive transcriptional repressor
MKDTETIKALKAIAHPTRFQMVQEVAAAGELTCGQLGERFKLAQPTISHHLKLLADSGVLLMRREAQHGIITVNRALVAELLGALPERLAPAAARASVRARKTPARGTRRR